MVLLGPGSGGIVRRVGLKAFAGLRLHYQRVAQGAARGEDASGYPLEFSEWSGGRVSLSGCGSRVLIVGFDKSPQLGEPLQNV